MPRAPVANLLHRLIATGVLLLSLHTATRAQPVTQPFTFSLIPHAIPHVAHGTVAWGDYDNDGDLDALVTGIASSGIVTSVYRNDGKQHVTGITGVDSSAVFTPVSDALVPVAYGRAAWGDYDNDGDLDLVVQGSRRTDPPFDPVTTLYRNDTGRLSPAPDQPFPGLHSGSPAWSDFDNDGDLDLLLSGEDAAGTRHTWLFRNDGNGAFHQLETELPGMAYGSADWGDYDSDGDLDLLLGGAANEGFLADIYRNDGNGQFTAVGAPFASVAFGTATWGDYDNDGDLDVLLSGGRFTPEIMEGLTHIYRNENGSFSRVEADIDGALAGRSTWGDYDNDGDLDLLVYGAAKALGHRTAHLYRNDDGSFTSATRFPGAIFAAADWGDYDNDGDLDLLATGLSSFGPSFTNVYENERQVIPPLPSAPSNLRAEVQGQTVRLHWKPAGTALSYNLRVGTEPRGTNLVSPMADPTSGRRLLARPGPVHGEPSWTLRDLEPGTYYWSVQAVNPAFTASPFAQEGRFTVTAATAVHTEPSDVLPSRFAVHPNYPNPFRSTTTIGFDLPSPTRVVLRIYDTLGREVATLRDGMMDAGTHTVQWDARTTSGIPAGAGTYFYELKAGGTVHTGRMTLLK